MDIIYIGRRDISYKIKMYAAANLLSYQEMPLDLLTETKNRIVAEAPRYLFVDLQGYLEIITVEEIIDRLSHIEKAIPTTISLIAPELSPESSVVKTLVLNGFNFFVLGKNLKGQEYQIERCIKKLATFSADEIEATVESREAEASRVINANPELAIENRKKTAFIKKRIAVIGTVSRIGTTTTAIQIAKYLNVHNSSCCYVERNHTGFINALKKYYVNFIEKNEGNLEYSGVDIFYNDAVAYVLHGRDAFEYYIYDFGSIDQADLTSVLDMDIIIAVCGISPPEMAAFTDIYKQFRKYSNVLYLFNFVHNNEKRDVLTMQQQKKDCTFFLAWAPDPFTYNPDNDKAFSTLLDISSSSIVEKQRKRKRGFFR